MYKHFFKRLLDFSIVFLALLIIWPILLVITIWLHFANKGAGAFYFSERIGRNEKLFRIYKFKSMTDEKDAEGNLLPDAERLTKVGKFIRATSIDELPQLFNVLIGDMSLIGPRPLPQVYLPYYTEEEHRRHDVRPGISGWAQVNGRKSISWGQKLAFDVEYVNKISFIFDLKILFLTFYKVIKRESVGVESSGVVSLYDFREAEWKKQGREDLIQNARLKSGRNLN